MSSPVLLVQPLYLVTEAGHQALHLSRGQPRPAAHALPLSVGLQRLPGQHPAPALVTGQAAPLGAQLRVVSTPGTATGEIPALRQGPPPGQGAHRVP